MVSRKGVVGIVTKTLLALKNLEKHWKIQPKSSFICESCKIRWRSHLWHVLSFGLLNYRTVAKIPDKEYFFTGKVKSWTLKREKLNQFQEKWNKHKINKVKNCLKLGSIITANVIKILCEFHANFDQSNTKFGTTNV